jgi:hypothetical protein
MTDARAFRGFRFPAEVVLWAVRWYLRFPVSYRDLEPCSPTAGVEVDHVTCTAGCSASRPSSRSGCAGTCALPRAVARRRDLTSASEGAGATSTGPSTATGRPIDFLLSATRDKKAARRFFRGARPGRTPATRGSS